MDPRFLDLYEEELRFVREMGAEFAVSHPKIASRLRLAEGETPDPYVERLLDGFAFLAARVRLRMDNEFPQLTESLLAQILPNVTAPTPSAAILELKPDFSEGALKDGFRIPRGASFTARADGRSAACDFRLCAPVILRPLAIDDASYVDRPTELSAIGAGREVRAALRIRIRSVAPHPLSALNLKTLSVYFQGDGGVAEMALEAAAGRSVGLVVRPLEGTGGGKTLPKSAIRHAGFQADEALLPQTPENFTGHRLLQEYFIAPEKFRFLELAGLDKALSGDDARGADIFILLDREMADLRDRFTAETIRLHCAPAVNIFPRRADRVRHNSGDREHHVVVDRTRPRDFEIFAVESVEGVRDKGSERTRFAPLYRAEADGKDADGEFSVRRERSLVDDDGYYGVETHLGLHQYGRAGSDPDITHLVVDTLCTNRALPKRLKRGGSLAPQSAGPVAGAQFIDGPTAPRPPLSSAGPAWALVDLLSFSHATLSSGPAENAHALRAALGLFAGARAETARLIEGVIGLDVSRIVRRFPGDGPPAYASGVGLDLVVDDGAFRGAGSFTLAAVLEEFFARATTLNAVTEFAFSADGKERVRWPVRTGRGQAL